MDTTITLLYSNALSTNTTAWLENQNTNSTLLNHSSPSPDEETVFTISRSFEIEDLEVYVILAVLIIAIGLSGNGVVLILYMRNTANYSCRAYAISLAIIDILAVTFLCPFVPFIDRIAYEQYQALLLYFSLFFFIILTYTSLLAATALDRAWAVYRPFAYDTSSRTQAYISIGIFIGCGIVTILSVTLASGSSRDTMVGFLFLASFCIMLVAYPATAHKLYRRARRIEARQKQLENQARPSTTIEGLDAKHVEQSTSRDDPSGVRAKNVQPSESEVDVPAELSFTDGVSSISYHCTSRNSVTVGFSYPKPTTPDHNKTKSSHKMTKITWADQKQHALKAISDDIVRFAKPRINEQKTAKSNENPRAATSNTTELKSPTVPFNTTTVTTKIQSEFIESPTRPNSTQVTLDNQMTTWFP